MTIVPLPAGPFEIVYADPAWFYQDRREGGNGTRFGGGCVNHYPVMSVEEICALPVYQIAAEDAWLFLWATWPTLPDALRVISAWGFKFSTLAFNWIKTNRKNGEPFFGIGHATKSNSEPCLLARRGSPRVASNYVSQIAECGEAFETEDIRSPRREHSRKPDEVRDRIVQLCGDRPRIELFARQAVEGWSAWGNEVPAEECVNRAKEAPADV